MVGEKNMRHSHATHDLYNAIASGDFPEWTWHVQVMPVDTDPASIGFDPLDDTKVHPPLGLVRCAALRCARCALQQIASDAGRRRRCTGEKAVLSSSCHQFFSLCPGLESGLNIVVSCGCYAQAILAADLVRVLLSVQLWPEEQFPLMEFGRMVLDENVKNYFSEVESIAFDPGVTVPGKIIPPRLLDSSRPHSNLSAAMLSLSRDVLFASPCLHQRLAHWDACWKSHVLRDSARWRDQCPTAGAV